MRIRTWLRYLIGDRQAILEVAANRRAVWIGFLFVLSAGFAREYDGEDLLHEPWYLFFPLIASLITSFVLFLCSDNAPAELLSDNPPAYVPAWIPRYGSFLGLYWLTAPLAWLYAVPYERLLSDVEAMRANLITLGVVAVWRVALMIRVVSVLWGYRWWAALFIVMLFADIVALLALNLVPIPIIDVMGGIRYTASERLLKIVAVNLCFCGFVTLPIWIIGMLAARIGSNPRWLLTADDYQRQLSTRGALLVLAGLSLAIWIFILPFTQPEQILRHRVESAMAAGNIQDAVAEMAQHDEADFPPLWDPPPKRFAHTLPVLAVVEVMNQQQTPRWLKNKYVKKLFNLDRYRHFEPDPELNPLLDLAMSFCEDPRNDTVLVFLESELSSEQRATLKRYLDLKKNELEEIGRKTIDDRRNRSRTDPSKENTQTIQPASR